MGMAASQARFLMLTARLSNVEFEGQQINQARSELADKTARAAAEYEEAMTNRRLLFDPLRQAYNDENNYEVFTYDSIVDSVENGGLGMRLVDANGKIIVPHLPAGIDEAMAEANDYIVDEKVYDSNYLEYNLRNSGWNLQKPDTKTKTSWTEYDLAQIYADQNGITRDKIDTTSDHYKNFRDNFKFDDIFKSEARLGMNLRLVNAEGKEVVAESSQAQTKNYIVDTDLKDAHLKDVNLTSKGYKMIFGKIEKIVTGWFNADWRSAEGVFDVLDKDDDGEAEAKYTRLRETYQAQDKKLELRQSQLNSEHNALQTEYDAVKKVIDKNVETTFKTFG